jgi:hypothetical protein
MRGGAARRIEDGPGRPSGVRPPAHVAPFVEALGEEGAVRLILELGGAYQHWAAAPREDSPVVRLVGMAAARRLAELDLPRKVPTARPWIAQVLRTRGLTANEIARQLHASYSSVQRWLSVAPEPGGDDRQGDLF